VAVAGGGGALDLRRLLPRLHQTKVDHHRAARLKVVQDVRRLDVSVDEALAVDVDEGREETAHVAADVHVGEIPVVQALAEVAVLEVRHEKRDAATVGAAVQHLHHVLMALERGEAQVFLVYPGVVRLAILEDLGCYDGMPMVFLLGACLEDHRKGALANGLKEGVAVKLGGDLVAHLRR